MAGIKMIDTEALAKKQAAYARAQREAVDARKVAEEKEKACMDAFSELQAIMNPNKRGPKAQSEGKEKKALVAAGE